jgi:hypothetical protein
MEWQLSSSPHPAPKNSECKNPLEKFSPRYLGWIKMASSSLITFQRTKLSIRSITHLYWCNWRTFWKSYATGRSPRGSWSFSTIFWLTSTCNPEETGLPGLLMSWSPTLFSRSNPVGLPPVPWTEKTMERSWRQLLLRIPGWMDNLLNFFEWLAKVRATC